MKTKVSKKGKPGMSGVCQESADECTKRLLDANWKNNHNKQKPRKP